MNNQFQYHSSAASLFSSAARQVREGNIPDSCICLEHIGDNGPCPVHGDQKANKPSQSTEKPKIQR